MPNRFIVFCQGQSASKWLARALDLHPEVVCSHWACQPHLSLDHTRDNTDYTQLELIEAYDAADLIAEHPIRDLFHEMKEVRPEAPVYGNIRAYTLRSFLDNVIDYGMGDLPRLATLIRHPVTWIESSVSFYTKMMAAYSRAESDIIANCRSQMHHLRPFLPQGKLALDPPVLAFLQSILQLSQLASDLKTRINGVENPIIQMEKVTRRAPYFTEVFEYLTQLKAEPDYVKEALQLPPSNRYSRSSEEPEEYFLQWARWQQYLFKETLIRTRIPELFRVRGADYDLDFLNL